MCGVCFSPIKLIHINCLIIHAIKDISRRINTITLSHTDKHIAIKPPKKGRRREVKIDAKLK